MNYEQLKNAIVAVIKQNGNEEITGDILQQVLVAMVNSLGNGFQFRGVAVPATAPGTPDQRVFYLASVTGTYPNFGLSVSDEICALVYDTEWHKQTIITLDQEPTEDSGNLISSGAIYTALQDLAGAYMQLVESAEENHLAIFDEDGQVKDAGIGLDDLALPAGRYPNLFAGFAGNLVDTRSAGTPQSPYTFRQSGGDGVDYLKRIKGRTLVWNQLVQNGDFSDDIADWTAYRAVATFSDGVAEITPTAADNTAGFASPIGTLKWIEGHKYLFFALVKGTSGIELSFSAYYGGIAAPIRITASGNWEQLSGIVTAGSTMAGYAALRVAVVQAADANLNAFYVRSVFCIDLTLMFGAGNEPSTVPEFRALFPLPYYDYNAGELKNNAATDLESTGFNQWDEEWELGTINTTTGEKADSSTSIRAKNDIAVFPNTAYFYCQPGSKGQPRLAFLDANHETISVVVSGITNNIFTTPANCRYIRFSSHATLYGTTYNHDICINISDPDRNGTYEPYWKATRHLGLDSIQAKEVGTDTIVTINGLDGVGDNVDLLKEGKTLTKNRARVDLGSLNWPAYRSDLSPATYPYGFAGSVTIPGKKGGFLGGISSKYAISTSGSFQTDKTIVFHASNETAYVVDSSLIGKTAEEVKAALSGVILDYPVATPKEYELVEPIQPLLEVDELGTERRLPEDTADVVNAPFESDSNYSISTANLVRKLSQ